MSTFRGHEFAAKLERHDEAFATYQIGAARRQTFRVRDPETQDIRRADACVDAIARVTRHDAIAATQQDEVAKTAAVLSRWTLDGGVDGIKGGTASTP